MGKKISSNIKNFWFRRDVAGMACGRQKEPQKTKNPEEAS